MDYSIWGGLYRDPLILANYHIGLKVYRVQGT